MKNVISLNITAIQNKMFKDQESPDLSSENTIAIKEILKSQNH